MSKPQFGDYGEPWAYASLSNAILREQGSVVCENSPETMIYDTDAKRIVACVNACAGLTDEELQRVRAVNELYKAAKLLEEADDFHSNDCPECEGETEPPELCGTCFPKFDEARIARRNAIAKADEGREP